MLAEGIHGDIDGVIMLRETISANMYFQMIGRAFACGKKTIPLIFDLVANSQFISNAADLSFPNELRGEIEKRKEEREKEGKDYEVGFDVDEFIVMDYFMDVVSGFKEIEGRLQGREWTEEEIEILKKWYPIEGTDIISRLDNRTRVAIRCMALNLGVEVLNSWTKEEIGLMKKYYPIKGLKIKSDLNEKTNGAMAIRLNLKTKKFWTDEEIDLLKKYYPKYGANIDALLLNKSAVSIKNKAGELKLHKLKNSIFTDEEDEIIKKYYPVEGENVYKRLNNKSKKQCISRANVLGIKKKWGNKYKYVYRDKGKYVVQFYVNGRIMRFGRFDSEDEAGKVAMEKAKEYGKLI